MVHVDVSDIDLESLNHGVEEYYQGWEAADQYCYRVLTGSVLTCKQTQLACLRYAKDKQRTDIEFRIDEVDELILFANRMKHVKGQLAGQYIELMQWMIFVLANVFGWYYLEGERQGERRFTKALILVARGNAKSFICSIISSWIMLTSPNGSPSCYSVARNAQQARIVFDDAKKMLRSAHSSISKHFRLLAHKIICTTTDGEFRPLSSDSQSADGLRIALGICDELHTHPTADLMNTLINGTSATLDPLIFSISTAGINLEGVCIQERDLVRQINSGLVQEDGYFGIEYTLDEGDSWEESKVWYKANPSLEHSVSVHALKQELTRAQQNAVNRRDFMTKYCNIFCNTNEGAYLDILKVQRCASNIDIEDYLGKEVWLGLDLAQKQDLCALSAIFPNGNGGIDIFQFHYLPDEILRECTPMAYERYQNWIDEGCVFFTEGAITDFSVIEEQIRWFAKEFDLKAVGFDPYAGGQMSNKLSDERIPMVEVRQGYANMNEPAKLLKALFASKRIRYQSNDKCFEWCCANAVQTEDLNSNIKITRARSKPHDKIDSVIALITGLALAEVKEKPIESPYKKRGLIIL